MELTTWVLVLTIGLGSSKGGVSTELIPMESANACSIFLDNVSHVPSTWGDSQWCVNRETGEFMIYSDNHGRVLTLPQDLNAEPRPLSPLNLPHN